MSTLTWYLFRTEPQKEFLAENILTRQGYPAFVPRETKWVKRRGRHRIEEKTYALVNGYIAMGFREPVNWLDVFRHRFLIGVVGWDGQPRPISAQGMARLRKLSETAIPARAAPTGRLAIRVGEVATVRHGPLAGYEGRVVEIDRTVAWMQDLFGNAGKISVPLDNLAAA